jgi:hypothetical protein
MRILNVRCLDNLFLHEYSILAMMAAKNCCGTCAVELEINNIKPIDVSDANLNSVSIVLNFLTQVRSPSRFKRQILSFRMNSISVKYTFQI